MQGVKYKTDVERKEAKREASRRWWKARPTSKVSQEEVLRRRRNRRRSNQRQVARISEIINRFKDVPCLDCGNRFPFECMDFDHVRGEKKFSIGYEGRKLSAKNTDVLLDEIAKCDVVCSNCHRVRTRKRMLEKQRQLDISLGLSNG